MFLKELWVMMVFVNSKFRRRQMRDENVHQVIPQQCNNEAKQIWAALIMADVSQLDSLNKTVSLITCHQ